MLDLCEMSLYAKEWLSDDGVIPRSAIVNIKYLWSIHFCSGSLPIQLLLLLFQVLITFSFTIGYFTKISSILSWVRIML